MKVLFTLQNINGNYADIVSPDGVIIFSQWAFNIFPQEHVCAVLESSSSGSSSSGSSSLAGDLIAMKRDGIKIKYDENENSKNMND
ncbi:hypothetical protein KAR91_34860 [Candidatus Pacearchaeota archaeon]|nr:hypothetical protein [Candidatus Pacearchaeota archaeon]